MWANVYQALRRACPVALRTGPAWLKEPVGPPDGEGGDKTTRALVGPDEAFGFDHKSSRSPFVEFSAGEIRWSKLL